MKKHTERTPIDELFARKLGNMSMPTSTDGFERLQARMGQQKPEAKIVFWRNPVVQRYMAAAACLVLICLAGWLYWPTHKAVELGQSQMAANQPVDKRMLPGKELNRQQAKPASDIIPNVSTSKADQLAVVNKAPKESIHNGYPKKQRLEREKNSESTPIDAAPVVARVRLNKIKDGSDLAAPTPASPINQTKGTTDQLAENITTNKPTPIAERVLDVTIAEPEALVAARQAAKTAVEEKQVIAQNEKPEKETKAGGLWQQVKRIKQGEIFARQDNATNEESGLLGRAYSGLKHSLDKEKPAKQ